jgi:GMP synthase-like glutamine amidotransferase
MQTYDKLKEIGLKYNDINFCGVIALCTVLDISFKRAKRKLEKRGRKHRRGTYDHTLHGVIRNHGYNIKMLPEGSGYLHRNKITANQAQKKYNKGTYLVTFHGSIDHVACLKDGHYNDWVDSKYRGKAPKFQVHEMYQVTKKEIEK